MFGKILNAYLFLVIVGPLCLVVYLSVDRFTYACRPTAPEDDCETTKTFDVNVLRMDVKETWILARLETNCILRGEEGRYVLHEVKFFVHGSLSKFSRIEMPAKQLTICEVI